MTTTSSTNSAKNASSTSSAPGDAEEGALITAARGGDRDALEKLLALEEKRIYAFGLRMCRNPDDARDVLQETMLAVAKNIGTFRGESSLSTWLFQIARSHCIKNRRRRQGVPAVHEQLDDVAEHTEDPRPGPEHAAGRREQQAMLQRALASLPAGSREVLVLRDVEGLTASEVAEVMGISVAAVKSRLHRARASLEDAFATTRGERAPVVPTTGRPDECPDVLALFSRNLEGDLTGERCAEMERHLERCPRCRGTCDLLKQSLNLCRTLPDVPDDVQTSVRAALRQFLKVPSP